MRTGTGHGGAHVAIARPLTRVTALLTAAMLLLVTAVLAVASPAQAAGERGTLSIQKTASVATARPGDRVTWTVQVTCESIMVMCEDVVLTDLVPTPFELNASNGVSVQGQQTGQATVVANGNDTTVTFRETDVNHPGSIGLAAGQSVSVLLQTTLPASTPLSWDGSSVTNTATATATNADQVSAPATVGIVVPVTPQVAATKTITPSDQVAGETDDVTVTLGVQNTSPVAATALTLTDPAAGSAAAFGPGTVLELRALGAWTAPEGATAVSVDLTTPSGVVTVGPFAAGTPIDTGAVDLATVSAVALRFDGSTVAAGSIVAGGAAGSVALVLGQNGTAPRDSTTRVTNVVGAAVSTPRGDATSSASDDFQVNPVTVEVTAGKTVDGSARAQTVAGQSSVVRLTARNSSNTALGTLRITEPAAGTTSPLGGTADDLLAFSGFGTDGSGTSDASTWPTGATGATVEIVGDGPDLPMSVPVAAPTAGGTVTWPVVPAGNVVTGFTVTYTGTIPAGTTATVPFQVGTDDAWTATHAFSNTVAVDGEAADGTTATRRTATAALTVLPRQVVTTTSKTLTQEVDGAALPGVVGQELIATITGRISDDTTVPVGSLVIEDVAGQGAGSTLWDAAGLVRFGSVDVPSGSEAEVWVRSAADGSWTSIAGPTTDATALLDLAAPAGSDGVRVVYTPSGSATSLAIDGSFTPKVALLMTLTSAQTSGTALTNTATTTGTGTGVGTGLTGTDDGSDSLRIGPGTTVVDIRRVDATKSWRDASALIPVDNTEPGADRPTNQLTMRVQNITGIPVTTLRLTDPDPGVAGDAFDFVDLTSLRVTLPTGATGFTMVLRDSVGTVLHTLTGTAAVTALTATDLAEVVSIEVTATGTSIPDNAVLTVVAGTVLRAETRTGTPILGTVDADPSTLLTNTVLGDLGPDTPSDGHVATTVLYPEAQQPLTAALSKSVSPDSGTRYSATDRTVRLSLTARRTSDVAVSRPAQYVLEDTSAAFWDAFDLVSLESLSGITTADGTGYTAAVEYLVDGVWTAAVTSDLGAGTSTTMPTLPSGAADLPAGTAAGDVTGVRVTFTAPSGSWFANRQVGGFEGVTALFTLSPRSTLRSTGAEVPTGTLTNTVTGTVQSAYLPDPVAIDPAQATYTVTDGTLDAAVSKTPTLTTTGPGAEVPFTLTVTNTGTAPIVNPVLTDVLPTDASGPQLVYDADAYGEVTVAATPTTSTIAGATPVVTVDGSEIRITFPAGTRLMPGEQVVATVPLVVRAGTLAGTVLTNGFELTADGGLSRQASADVEVIALANYLRVKDVAEDLTGGATPTGVVNVSASGTACTSTDGFYRQPCLVRTQPGGSETWRLRLKNTGNLPTASATLVDVLPSAGDTGTSKSQSSSSRGSTWATEYLGDLELLDLPTGATSTVWYLLDGETCTYTGDARSSDPRGTGCDDDAWTPAEDVTDLGLVRGIRVDLDFTADLLEPGEQVAVTFRTRSASATTAADLGTDAPAWNTMVVSTASVTATGLSYETLEPNRAGVAVTYVPGGTTTEPTDPGTDDPGTDEPGVTTPGTGTPTGGDVAGAGDPTADPSGRGVLADGDLATTGAQGVTALLAAAGVLLLAGVATVLTAASRRRRRA